MKDLPTKTEILRRNSSGNLYTFHPFAQAFPVATVNREELWHCRLGHPSLPTMASSFRSNKIACSRSSSTLCQACQLGRRVKLPFSISCSTTARPFELIHCDLWISPDLSNSGFQYYLTILDDFPHYIWTFILSHKSDVHVTLRTFHAYATTQFNLPIQAIQCDNSLEFDNTQNRSFFLSHGTLFRFLCPDISQQNGKA